jgi:L-alanine-DL-glutamate epimerase-like enolase superfamily enzyme
MHRRTFLKSLAAVSAAGMAWPRLAEASLPTARITRVRILRPPSLNATFNQSNMVVEVETDAGLTGIGEGGTTDMLEQAATALIGQDPFRTNAIWQEMDMAWFYSPGHEKMHAVGALDLALWDIKGKALGVPVHQLLGGAVRDHCECYPTSGVPGPARGVRDRARAVMDAGYRAYRADAGGGPVANNVYDAHERVRLVAAMCKEIRDGVGPNGDWCIDFHQRFDYPDALRCCRLIEEYEPYFVEDPVREEQFREDIPKLRQMTAVPLAAGEEWGQRADFNTLVDRHDIDYTRSTLPNVGGITEILGIMALCNTHAVGIVPHFTGPIATAALVHVLSTFPGPVLFEYNYGTTPIDYLPEFLDFREGKLYPNDRPGLGVTIDPRRLTPVGEITERANRPLYQRPDGSPTHW